MTLWKIFTTSFVFLSVAACSAKQVKETPAPKKDAFESFNRGMYSFNENLDKAILKPIAKGYMWATPDIVEKGVTNFFSNINDIGVTVNDLLQFKMTQSGMDASRFIVNTTAGGLGVVDVAQMVDLPKHNEDFGQTLGFWGVPAGNFLMLPFAGPSSPREMVGMLGDAILNPFSYTFLFGGGVAVTAVSTGVNALDVTNTRATLMGTEKMINEAASDKYNFIKNAYQQRREYLLHDGNISNQDDIDVDDIDVDDIDVLDEDSNYSAPALKKSSIQNIQLFSPKNTGLPPVINNSRRFLELSAPK